METMCVELVAAGRPGDSADDNRPFVEIQPGIAFPDTSKLDGDRGTVGGYVFDYVSPGYLGRVRLHHEGSPDAFCAGESAMITIESARRAAIACSLFAGTLIKLIAQRTLGLEDVAEMFKFHKERIDLSGMPLPNADFVKRKLDTELRRFLRSNQEINITGDPTRPSTRRLHIGDFNPVPCAGPMIGSTDDVESLTISNVKQCGSHLRVCYSVVSATACLRS